MWKSSMKHKLFHCHIWGVFFLRKIGNPAGNIIPAHFLKSGTIDGDVTTFGGEDTEYGFQQGAFSRPIRTNNTGQFSLFKCNRYIIKDDFYTVSGRYMAQFNHARVLLSLSPE